MRKTKIICALGPAADSSEEPSDLIIRRLSVEKCIRRGHQVIEATHKPETMIANPIPTRVEITDMAHACFEQADATMLSGERLRTNVPFNVYRLSNALRAGPSTFDAKAFGISISFTVLFKYSHGH